jgi:2Fe-2S ferredoxin
MPKVIYVATDGARREVEAKRGVSVMQTAISNGIDGIVAECGGSMQCATCHVYVDEAWLARLKPMSDVEDAMLDSTASERKPNSRLSCQIDMTPELDGLTVHLPPTQI